MVTKTENPDSFLEEYTQRMITDHLLLAEDHLLDYSRKPSAQCLACLYFHLEKLIAYTSLECVKFPGMDTPLCQKLSRWAATTQGELDKLSQKRALELAREDRNLRYAFVGKEANPLSPEIPPPGPHLIIPNPHRPQVCQGHPLTAIKEATMVTSIPKPFPFPFVPLEDNPVAPGAAKWQYMTTDSPRFGTAQYGYWVADTAEARARFIKNHLADAKDIKLYKLPPESIELMAAEPIPVGYSEVHRIERFGKGIKTKGQFQGGTYWYAPIKPDLAAQAGKKEAAMARGNPIALSPCERRHRLGRRLEKCVRAIQSKPKSQQPRSPYAVCRASVSKKVCP